MDDSGLQELISLGEDALAFKCIALAGTTMVIWDHLLTLSDEVQYVWKKRSWVFWLFIVSRYSVLFYKIWDTIKSLWPGYTQEVCNRTVKLEVYYFVFIMTLGQIFLTMRVYALTRASKYVLVAFAALVVSSFVTGVWLVSAPQSQAIQMPKIKLDSFRACVFFGSATLEWAYRSQIVSADLIAFVCVIAFAFRFKAVNGPRMTLLTRTIVQDGTLYFFVMMVFHIAMLLFVLFTRPSARGFPPTMITVLIPIMVSRLVISLRKAADSSVVQAWDGNRFITIESGAQEATDSPGLPLSPLVFSSRPLRSPIPNTDLRQSRPQVVISASGV